MTSRVELTAGRLPVRVTAGMPRAGPDDGLGWCGGGGEADAATAAAARAAAGTEGSWPWRALRRRPGSRAADPGQARRAPRRGRSRRGHRPRRTRRARPAPRPRRVGRPGCPARPWPSTGRDAAARSAGAGGDAGGVAGTPVRADMPPAIAAPVAHGGGAAQSRGGLRGRFVRPRACSGSGGVARSAVAGWPSPRTGRRGAVRASRGRRRGWRPIARGPRVRGLATRPVLERRADRERRREAVRLLVGDRARRRRRLGEASVAVVRTGRTSLTVVPEGDERTGRGTVHAGQPSLSHRADDTRWSRSAARPRWASPAWTTAASAGSPPNLCVPPVAAGDRH